MNYRKFGSTFVLSTALESSLLFGSVAHAEDAPDSVASPESVQVVKSEMQELNQELGSLSVEENNDRLAEIKEQNPAAFEAYAQQIDEEILSKLNAAFDSTMTSYPSPDAQTKTATVDLSDGGTATITIEDKEEVDPHPEPEPTVPIDKDVLNTY
ncbi:hypothetical protein P4361_18630 [Fictibacillus sp. B-59209]|uniref:hypothetical protein n=1 Tax=Fictibacillus sp. B-59209 TaxID=3024873 RepID=UPI002E1A7D5D|nr:hypothetical protein [Fictibacillus sp. B-59209]